MRFWDKGRKTNFEIFPYFVKNITVHTLPFFTFYYYLDKFTQYASSLYADFAVKW